MQSQCPVAYAENLYQAGFAEPGCPTCSLCLGEIGGEWITDDGPAYFEVANLESTEQKRDGSHTHTSCKADAAVRAMDAKHRESLAKVYRLCVELANELDTKTTEAIEKSFPFMQLRSLDDLATEVRKMVEAGRDDEPKWIAGAVAEGEARELRARELEMLKWQAVSQ